MQSGENTPNWTFFTRLSRHGEWLKLSFGLDISSELELPSNQSSKTKKMSGRVELGWGMMCGSGDGGEEERAMGE
jgi:hypothetical protein